MPRYFFDIHDVQPHRDSIGADLADDDAAWIEAKRCIREAEDALTPGDKWQLTVRQDVRFVFRIEIKTTGWLGRREA
jgi:uncharacterized protein DUF6894